MISKVDALLREVIHGRLRAVRNGEASSYGNDLLGCMFTAASDGWDEESLQFNLASVLNNCKLFYFAGQDTVANAVGFTMLMLALRPEWQERARNEVLEVFGDEENFNASVFSRLKVVQTLIHSAPWLRVYGIDNYDLHIQCMLATCTEIDSLEVMKALHAKTRAK